MCSHSEGTDLAFHPQQPRRGAGGAADDVDRRLHSSSNGELVELTRLQISEQITAVDEVHPGLVRLLEGIDRS